MTVFPRFASWSSRPPRYRTFLVGALFALLPSLLLAPATFADSPPPATVDGLQVAMTTTDYSTDPPRVDQGSMRVAGGDVVIDLTIRADGTEAQHTTIYRGDQREFLVVDHAKKQFTVLDPASIDTLIQHIEAAVSAIDDQVANLPPEQQEIVRKALAEDRTVAPTEVRRTNDTGRQQGFNCARYEVWRGPNRLREAWVANWLQIPHAVELKNALSNLDGFFVHLTEAFAKVQSSALGGMPIFDLGDDNPFRDLQAMGGFPVVTRNFENDLVTTETVVRSIEAATLPRDFATPPEGYQRQELASE
ncbi:MAG: hypothetical protein AAGE94_00860 [Acidobacteriota bacterium]